MDRDQRWERTERALAAILAGEGEAGRTTRSPPIEASYARGVTDEFVEPVVLPLPRLARGDAAIHFNFRPDRARQLSQRLLGGGRRPDDDDPLPRRLRLPGRLRGAGGRGHDRRGARRARRSASCTSPRRRSTRTSPTSSTAGARRSGPGETRILVPSPRDVATYDQKPEMSAAEVAERFAAEIPNGYAFAIVNYANPDMVGHTGVIPAVVRAVEATDAALGRRWPRSRRSAASASSRPTTGTPSSSSRPTASAPHRAHDEPGAAGHHAAGAELEEGGALADLVPTCLWLLGVPHGGGDERQEPGSLA